MEALRTPEERFGVLPFFPWAPHYVEDLPGFAGLRMHYVDEGPRDPRDTYLCLHGEPTWSYLYRKMLPVFREAGGRVVAPDLFGFGRSDKPVRDADYTFAFHRESLLRLVERLDLRNVTLVVQDWGGILGLTLPMELPGRFASLIAMNTALPAGLSLGPGFAAWKSFAAQFHDVPVAGLIALSSPGALNPFDAAAYDAPFPDARYKAGVRRFPQLVPVEPGMAGIEHCQRARRYFAEEWRGQSFMAIGLRDPVLGKPVMEELRATIRGCPTPLELPEAGHFVQEWGDVVARAALASFAG
ncbi:MAG: alpha/beta fold hydrolase [Deltaproteobacteria bacterium]|nr:alpha/beta fold hydrolase [Deltaproteobacteria bacterium]